MALTDSQIKHYRQLAKQQLGLSRIDDRRLSVEQKRLIENKVKTLSGQELDNDQMAAMNARNRANNTIDSMWGDFGTGGLGETMESPGFDGIRQPSRQSDQTEEAESLDDEENSNDDNKQKETTESKEAKEDSTDEGRLESDKGSKKTPEETTKPKTSETAENTASRLGKKSLEEAAQTAANTAKAAETAGVAAETASVAAEGAVAVEFLPWIIGIIVVIVVVVLLAGIKLPIGGPEDKSVAGTQSTICLDPGHPSEVGSGTTGPSGTTEKEMVLKVANELRLKLQTAGYKVVLTRTDNSTLVTNKERAQICSQAGAAIMYRIHLNNPGGIKGPFHWYPPSKYAEISSTSKNYADTIHNEIVATLGIKGKTSGSEPIDGGVHPDGKELEGSRAANELKLPTVLIEMMTMDANGEKWITNDSNRAKMVEGMFKGIQKAIPPTSGGSATGVVGKAKSQLGVAYQWGACHNWTSPSVEKGCSNYDCSGFAGWAWYWGTDKKVNIDGTTSTAWANRNSSKYTVFYDEKMLQPGDLIYWSNTGIHHVGIYLSKDTYIHAPKTGDVVKISKISQRGEKAAGYLRPKQ